MDLSLDDVIKQNKKSRPAKSGGGGGGGRGGGRNRSGGDGGRGGANRRVGVQNGGRRRSDPLRRTSQEGVRKQTQERGPAKVADLRQNVGNSEKKKEALLVISNLDVAVTDSDIKDLFLEFGELKRANVNYDRNGVSLGTAEVIYKLMADAQKAFKQYNGVPLDGKPLDIKLAASQTDVFRSVPPAARSGGNRERRGGQGKGPRRASGGGGGGGARLGDRPPRTANGGREGGGRRGGRGGAGGRENRPKMSLEDLDKQLEDYANGGDGAAYGKSDDGAVNGKSGGGGGGGRRGGRGGGRRGGRGPKRPEVSAEDLDKQLDSYINRMEDD